MNLAKLQQLHRAATAEPWRSHDTEAAVLVHDLFGVVPRRSVSVVDCSGISLTEEERIANAALLLYVRNALPEILSRLEAAEKMRVALNLIHTFAWTAVTADCEGSRIELQGRINACRDVLAAYDAAKKGTTK